MSRNQAPLPRDVLETERLRLRPWRIDDAPFHRQLWLERDSRVPAHRRITPDGRPTLNEMEDWLRHYEQMPAPGLLVVEHRESAITLGYCGLVSNSVGQTEEPELAYEFLRRAWNQGFATEASRAILTQAKALGYQHLASTVREWNTGSLRVLEKLGFTNTGESEADEVHGDSLLLRKTL